MAPQEREMRLLKALQANILKERQRKKEEHEAEVEEERLRKEREARERQDVMTLGETREQIKILENKLQDCLNQKQSLFLQLKKVLNEDETRRKQQRDNELMAIQQMHQQMQYAQALAPPRPAHQQILPKGSSTGAVQIGHGNKRGRSPSPPSRQYFKGSLYSDSPREYDRKNDVSRVLWKQPAVQYQNPGTLFYQTTPNPPDSRSGVSIMFPTYNMPLRPNYHMEIPQQAQTNQAHLQKTDPQSQVQQKPTQVFHINLDQPSAQKNTGSHKPQVTMEKISSDRNAYVEVKLDHAPHLPEGVYTNLMPGLPMHPNVMQQMQSNQSQSAKTGGISQGYPNSRQPQQQQIPGQPSQQQIRYKYYQ